MNNIKAISEAERNIFQKMRRMGVSTDMSIICDSNTFHVHKAFLATASDYYFNHFQKKKLHKFEIIIMPSEVKANIMELLLTYIYTGEVKVVRTNVNSFLHAAKLMKIDSLLQQSCSSPEPKPMIVQTHGKYQRCESAKCNKVSEVPAENNNQWRVADYLESMAAKKNKLDIAKKADKVGSTENTNKIASKRSKEKCVIRDSILVKKLQQKKEKERKVTKHQANANKDIQECRQDQVNNSTQKSQKRKSRSTRRRAIINLISDSENEVDAEPRKKLRRKVRKPEN